jgi:dTDP-4-amino-4,6-dideoxygalactose transaminase
MAARYELRMVEDCAQSIGARSRGAPTGLVGEIAATSFYPTKNLGCLGDGGAVLTSTSELAERARCLRDYGQTKKYEHALCGLNSRLDEVQAAVMRDAMLPRLAEWTERRRAIAARYRSEIANPALAIPPEPPGSESACHLFPVLVDDPEAFIRHLAGRGIGAGRHYPGTIPDQAALRGVEARVLGTLERARRFASREVSLPLHPFLGDEDVARVVAACRGFAA